MQMSASFGGILTLYVYNHCFQTWDQVCLINGLIATTGHLVVVSEDDCIQRLCLFSPCEHQLLALGSSSVGWLLNSQSDSCTAGHLTIVSKDDCIDFIVFISDL